MIYWLTGQPGAGKTVLGQKIKGFLDLLDPKKKTFIVDGDDIRQIWQNQDYSEEGRKTNIRNAQALVEYLHRHGHVVVSLVAPYRELREEFKEYMYPNIVEIYVHTTEERGREHYHSNDYEPPIDYYIDIDTTKDDPDDSLQRIIAEMINMQIKFV